MKRSFPCWVCKGQGGFKEIVCDDGTGPYEECNYCEGKRMIEINGKRHMEIKRENIAMKALLYFDQSNEAYSFQELREIGEKIEKLIIRKDGETI